MTERQTAVFGKTPMWDMVDWEDLYKPEESALLVIDPQNDILKKEGNMDYYGMWQDAPRTIEAIGALVRGARARKVPVFWFRYVRLANGKDVFPNSLVSARLKMLRSRIPNIFADGSWDIDIVDELKELMEDEDFIIDKHASGCFEGTMLEKYLRQMGVKNLVLCGYLTDFCVASTARTGYDKGYGTILVSDACNTHNADLHRAAVDMHRWYLGPVISTNNAVSLMGG
ncbi:MAG: cysteine hydrolase family protein [Rhizobiaceae bacterium]